MSVQEVKCALYRAEGAAAAVCCSKLTIGGSRGGGGPGDVHQKVKIQTFYLKTDCLRISALKNSGQNSLTFILEWGYLGSSECCPPPKENTGAAFETYSFQHGPLPILTPTGGTAFSPEYVDCRNITPRVPQHTAPARGASRLRAGGVAAHTTHGTCQRRLQAPGRGSSRTHYTRHLPEAPPGSGPGE